MTRTRRISALVAIVGIAMLAPAYVRVHRVAGPSDAPSFLVGDRVFVVKMAYDIRLPYTDIVLLPHSQPQRGDVVAFRPPGRGFLVFKRIVGGPGDTVFLRGGRLVINDVPLRYEEIDASELESIAEENEMGELVGRETGNGRAHFVTYSPGPSPDGSFGPVRVPEDRYFVLGDNRDHSEDSRQYGSIPRRSILGKVIRASGRAH